MKPLALAIVLFLCWDTVFNQHRATSNALAYFGSSVRETSDEFTGSVFDR